MELRSIPSSLDSAMSTKMGTGQESRLVASDDAKNTAAIEISWGDKRLFVELDENAVPVYSLYERLTELTGVPSDRIRLIHAGKVLREESQVLQGWRVRMVGSSVELNGIEDSLVKDDLSKNGPQRRRYAVNANELNEKEHGKSVQMKYGFKSIETLPGLPDEATARSILTELARDPGIRFVMDKYKWTVGTLCEMYPEGYVGVSDVCVMGLNQNRGNRIFLRLRTDDLRGFRKILSIRKVLFHELAHNRHDDHNDDFYRLMREIEREAERGDWTRSRGYLLEHVGRPIQLTPRLNDGASIELDNGRRAIAPRNSQEEIRSVTMSIDRTLRTPNSTSSELQPSNVDGNSSPMDCNQSLDYNMEPEAVLTQFEDPKVLTSQLIDAIHAQFLRFQIDENGIQSRLDRFHDTIVAFLKANDVVEARETLLRVHEIVGNVRRSSEAKFSILRKANKLFRRYCYAKFGVS